MEIKTRNMTSIYILTDKEMLLLYRIGSKVVSPSFCGIGGHFEKEELNDPKSCILRELYEEINLTENNLIDLSLRYVTMRLKNNEIRQNYYYFAKIKDINLVSENCNEGIIHWVKFDDILDKGMPHTAKYVLKHYLSIGKNSDLLFAGIATGNDINFEVLEEF